MRKSFVKAINEVMDKNDKVVVIIGDIGAYLLKDIKNKYPDRMMNMGIAEANMMDLAAALALDGWIPYVYTITPFVTARCYDQIRVGVGIHNANVKIVGIGSGITYGYLGSTHHSIEDIALMRVIPEMTVISPGDGDEAYQAILAASTRVGPVYLRLTRDTLPVEIVDKCKFAIGKAKTLINGNDLTIITTGEIIHEMVEVAAMLKNDGINIRLLHMPTIKPLDKAAINKAVKDTKGIITVEEHNIIGGLGSAVAENLLETGVDKKFVFKRIGIEDAYVSAYGNREEIYSSIGLDAKGLYKKIKNIAKQKK